MIWSSKNKWGSKLRQKQAPQTRSTPRLLPPTWASAAESPGPKHQGQEAPQGSPSPPLGLPKGPENGATDRQWTCEPSAPQRVNLQAPSYPALASRSFAGLRLRAALFTWLSGTSFPTTQVIITRSWSSASSPEVPNVFVVYSELYTGPILLRQNIRPPTEYQFTENKGMRFRNVGFTIQGLHFQQFRHLSLKTLGLGQGIHICLLGRLG